MPTHLYRLRCEAGHDHRSGQQQEASELPSTSASHSETEQKGTAVGKDLLGDHVRKLGKAITVGALCVAMALATVSPALAARSGGYMGGSNFGSNVGRVGGVGGSRLGTSGFDSFGMSSKSPRVHTRGGLSTRGHPMTLHSFGWFGPPVYYGGYGYPVGGGGGGGFGTILLLGIAAAIIWTLFTSNDSAEYSEYTEYSDGSDARVTVAKVQVGLLGSARQLQQDLERIADKADTDSPSGLHYILQETVLALLRNPDYCVYGATDTSRRTGLQAGEARFNEFSMQERSKFKQETLVNVGGRRRSSNYPQGGGQKEINELIVVTILVAVEGALNLPVLNSLEDLRTVLNRLGGIGSDQTLAVEVLWTPQDENDYYTKDEIFQDYPTLIPL